MSVSTVTILGGWLWAGCRAWRAAGRGPAAGCLPPRGRRGSGVKAGRRPSPQAMLCSLEAGGAGPYAARTRGISGGVSRLLCGPLPRPGRSGCGAGQDLIQRLRGGFPAQGLAGPGVELGGDGVQVLAAVHRQVRALGEVLAQQPVGVLVAAALPGRVGVAEVDR